MEVTSDKPEVIKSEDYEVIEHDVSDKLVKVLDTDSSTHKELEPEKNINESIVKGLTVDEFDEKDVDALEDEDLENDDEEYSHLKPQERIFLKHIGRIIKGS